MSKTVLRLIKIDENTARRKAGIPVDFGMCFVPRGASRFQIYTVQLREHPGVVKIGKTKNWPSRRKSYETWNLASGDGCQRSTTFTITEEFIDLDALELHILDVIRARFRSRAGREWFLGDYDEVTSLVCGEIEKIGITFDVATSEEQ